MKMSLCFISIQPLGCLMTTQITVLATVLRHFIPKYNILVLHLLVIKSFNIEIEPKSTSD